MFWTKNGQELDTNGSGGRYSEVTVDNPSLTIFDVNQYDAGSYQLTATNALGSTSSDTVILGIYWKWGFNQKLKFKLILITSVNAVTKFLHIW